MRRFLMWLMRHLPKRVIFDREGAKPYLTRGYIFGGPRNPEVEDVRKMVWKKRPFNVFLHRFHMSDDADALHNHPWKWSFSIILLGGYIEDRRRERASQPGHFDIVSRIVRPGSLNVIRDTDYHRVDLLDGECWTIFVAGPKAGSWSFWNPMTKVTKEWWRYIADRRGITSSRGPDLH